MHVITKCIAYGQISMSTFDATYKHTCNWKQCQHNAGEIYDRSCINAVVFQVSSINPRQMPKQYGYKISDLTAMRFLIMI